MDIGFQDGAERTLVDEEVQGAEVAVKPSVWCGLVSAGAGRRGKSMGLLWKTVKITPFSLARAIRRSASALVLTKGFSTTTDPGPRQISCCSRRGREEQLPCFPARRARSTNSSCACVRMMTSSMASSAKKLSAVRWCLASGKSTVQ